MEWDLNPGDTIRRKELHDKFGGNRQGGISPSNKTPNVFVFTDPSSGHFHGYYDEWVGDVLHYCGEGQRGDQTMKHGNKAIRDHEEDGRSLRLFEGAKGEVTYRGEFALDAKEPFYTTTAHESGGTSERTVIKFKLRPIGDALSGGNPQASLGTSYRRADESPESAQREPFEVDPNLVDRALGSHARLQNLLANEARDRGLEPLSPGTLDPDFDLAWSTERLVTVVEVKSITSTNEVRQLRMGLGQVLHYADSIRRTGRNARAVLMIEREPSDARWIDLCSEHGVALVWPGEVSAAFH